MMYGSSSSSVAPIQDQPQKYNNRQWDTGLEGLAHMDKVIVQQKKEVLEIVTGFETRNRYVVQTPSGEDMFRVEEESDCCTRFWCGKTRPLELTIKDLNNRELIHIHRPLNCQGCCCPCCLQYMEVSSPPGSMIGSIEEQWSFLKPRFVVKDQTGEIALRIEGPFCPCGCCRDVQFQILSADGTRLLGKITKVWSGFLQETFTDCDTLMIDFPKDTDLNMKSTLLGALFLVDFMFFEKTKQRNRSE